jgi:hypothetical protein
MVPINLPLQGLFHSILQWHHLGCCPICCEYNTCNILAMIWGSHGGEYEDGGLWHPGAHYLQYHPDGGSTDLSHTGKLIPVYMVLQPRKQPSAIFLITWALHYYTWNRTGCITMCTDVSCVCVRWALLIRRCISIASSLLTELNEDMQTCMDGLINCNFLPFILVHLSSHEDKEMTDEGMNVTAASSFGCYGSIQSQCF